MLRALGVFSSFPSVVVSVVLVFAALVVFCHAIWTVRSEVRLNDNAMLQRAAASSNASQESATLTSAGEPAEEANGVNVPSESHANAANERAQRGINSGPGHWLSFLQHNLCAGGDECMHRRDVNEGNGSGDGSLEVHQLEIEMAQQK